MLWSKQSAEPAEPTSLINDLRRNRERNLNGTCRNRLAADTEGAGLVPLGSSGVPLYGSALCD